LKKYNGLLLFRLMKTTKRPLKIVSTGSYLPQRVVSGHEVDRKLGLSPGKSEMMTGIAERRYVTHETASEMGAFAIMSALEKSGIKFEEIDAIICASGSTEQALPCTAALIQRALKRPGAVVPCFDVNATCLSFVTALDLASSLLATDRFKTIAIVSTEIASVGLNPAQHEAYALFGDGAAAAIVQKPQNGESSGVIHAQMNTYSEGADHCRILGGGTKFHPKNEKPESDKFLFSMDGKKVFRLVLETIPDFFEQFMKDSGLTLDDLQLIVPHQASGNGMELVRRKLGIDSSKYMDILAKHGNMIAASIPLALHMAIEQGRVKRGDRVMLLGTSAGMSIGSVVFEY
jgi:3-oxoacyl-[acyl-carrier-protein] synthase-3